MTDENRSDQAPNKDQVANKTVSVVLLNWNSGDLGAKAAASVRGQTTSDIELIVVDNASDDDSLRSIEKAAAPDRVAAQPTNTGFAKGMNIGVGLSDRPFVLLLNCDAELDPNYVEAALAVHHRYGDTAVVGGQVTSPRSGVTGPISITATMRTQPGPTEQATVCEKVDGSCPLHRRKAVEQVRQAFGVAPFDPSYDTYGEDIDLAHKYRRLGWTLRYAPEARATHVRSFSSAHRLRDRRGRLRINNLTNRHRNLARHGQLLHWPRMVAEDVVFAALGPFAGDWSAPGDVARSWRKLAGTLRSDLGLRADGTAASNHDGA